MVLLAICQATFSNVKEVIVDAKAPANPYKGLSWTDTSKTPPVTKIWDGEKWVDSITDAMDKIQIGGRNLLRYTKDISGHTAYVSYSSNTIIEVDNEGFAVATIAATGGYNALGFYFTDIPIEDIEGKQVVISAWTKSDGLKTFSKGFQIAAGVFDSSNNRRRYNGLGSFGTAAYNVNDYVDAEWVRLIWQGTLPPVSEMIVSNSTEDYVKYGIQFYVNAENTQYPLQVKKVQCEFGTKPTDWTPAPEDVQSKIDDANIVIQTHSEKLSDHDTKISANETAISLRVTKQEYEVNKTTINNEIASAKSRLSNAESSIDILHNQISLKVEQTDIDDAVQGIRVGARNLYINTGLTRGTTALGWWQNTITQHTDEIVSDAETKSGKARKITYTEAGKYGPVWSASHLNGKTYKAGASYTQSCMMKASVDINISWGCEGLTKQNANVTTEWQRFTFTVTASNAGTMYRSASFYPISSEMPAGGVLYIADYKMEEGNRATDWTPAPEDIDASIAAVDARFVDYSTTTQMTAAITASKDSILSSVSQTYSTKTELTTATGRISTLETWKSEASQKITRDGIIATVGNYYAYESDLQAAENRISTVETKATQTANQFSWLVKSGTSSTDFVLTDRAVKLVTDTIDLSASNLVNIISSGAAKIEAKNIELEGIVTANSNFKILADGSMEAISGKFAGEVTATSGSFKGTIDAETLKAKNNITIYDGTDDQVVVSYYNASSSATTTSGRSTGIEFGNSAVEATYSSKSNLFAGTAYFSKEAQFNAATKFYDSAVFTNSKGIRSLDTSGVDHALLYLGSDNVVTLGNTSQVAKIQGSTVRTVGTVYLGANIVASNNNAYYCQAASGTNRQIAMIDTNDTFLVGSPSHVTAIRGTSVRLASATGTVVTSDRRAKRKIRKLDQRHLNFFTDLEPVHFKMREGNDQKVRYGFIAQDIEAALNRNNFSRDDFAGLDIVTENGQEVYGLIYEQFTALNTYAIQCTRKEMRTLKIDLGILQQKNRIQEKQIESLQYQLSQAFDRISKYERKIN